MRCAFGGRRRCIRKHTFLCNKKWAGYGSELGREYRFRIYLPIK
ncbi:MAG: hypothetical protein HPY66_2091 [Firmicutes bacterium]|nr:hypothetical protein [Bacillota bacterium]